MPRQSLPHPNQPQPPPHNSGPLRLQRLIIAGLVVVVLVLAVVLYGMWNMSSKPPDSGLESPTGTPSADQPTPSESASPSDDRADKPNAITDVDLSNREWRFRVRDGEFTVPFSNGKYNEGDEYEWIVDDEMTVYSDADKDGYLDAATVVSKYYVGGNGWERFVVLWRWNPQTQQAEIVPDVVGHFVRCYGTLDSLQAVKGGFRFSGLVVPDDSVDSSCAQPRGEHYSRTVGINGLDPVRIDATGGWGGMCGRPIGDAGVGQTISDVADEFKVAPRSDAPDITVKIEHFGQANGDPFDRGAAHYYRGDYVLVYYFPHDVDFEHLGETPCGWAKLKPGEPRG